MSEMPTRGNSHSSTKGYRILVVDDDLATRRMVGDRLKHEGFEVFTASSGYEAISVIEGHGLPHLAIVDVMMPNMNGFELCEWVQEFCDLPIILLTAVDEEDTIIYGLERFAEDYVTKPFSPRILVARVERVLRRIGDFSYALSNLTQVDNYLAIDFVHQQAVTDDTPIPLTRIETKLLYLLMRNAGRITSTDFLISRLWPLEEVFEETLRVHVHRLRKKIEIDPAEPHYVITKRGSGYTFPAAC